MRDQQIADLIARENHRQVEGIELIASENYASDQVMEAQGSVLTNKYAEGLPRAGITAVAKWWTKSSSWRLIGCANCLVLHGPMSSRTRVLRPMRLSCSRYSTPAIPSLVSI